MIENARKLFAGPCDFMLSVAALKQLPDAALPEIAFAGRSNVGKSSLVNALTGRKTLAKTSGTPGRTPRATSAASSTPPAAAAPNRPMASSRFA